MQHFLVCELLCPDRRQLLWVWGGDQSQKCCDIYVGASSCVLSTLFFTRKSPFLLTLFHTLCVVA